jgi:hypothetical protein
MSYAALICASISWAELRKCWSQRFSRLLSGVTCACSRVAKKLREAMEVGESTGGSSLLHEPVATPHMCAFAFDVLNAHFNGVDGPPTPFRSDVRW